MRMTRYDALVLTRWYDALREALGEEMLGVEREMGEERYAEYVRALGRLRDSAVAR